MTDATRPDTGLKKRALKLIDNCRTMTLATADGNTPWAAPVYYVYVDAGFYFFSDSDSRHVREAVNTGQCAAAIFAEGDSWQQLQGLQMSGTVSRVRTGPGAVRILSAYLKKFPMAKSLTPDGIQVDLQHFTDLFHVRLYRFSPGQVLYMDNSVRFGYRKEITLP